ncbi:MAG: photosystem II assembly protein Psb35 [Pleurocapsa sp.]
MFFLAEVGTFPTYFVAVYVIGFIAAVSIGSIAWYNSKRPAGWEDAKRPDIIPDLDVKDKSDQD